ncbi:MAG TPA: 4-hydroxybenzoate 3-monooxygenase [Actinomycetales bacterium]|jgi:p-hydroxybenzoate 3-monooxygenase
MSATTRTQVGIIGAGPAGLLLAHLLAQRGIDSVVLEARSRDYVEARLRAGVLEQPTVDALVASGAGERLLREGLRHEGIYLQSAGVRQRVDFPSLCGQSVWVYGQSEVVKDLIALRLAAGLPLHFESGDVAVHDVESDRPALTWTSADGAAQRLECDVVAACDGFHGIGRPAVPESLRTSWKRTYPFSWLGILAQVPPSSDELVYAHHRDGFAMHSLRSPQVSRLYLQVPVDEDLAAWSDDRIWDALSTRLGTDGWTLQTGPITDRSITPMRSFVSTPMRHGNLFLAGDAAHIVPPTGAKGLNLAAADVQVLAPALAALLADGDPRPAAEYSATAERRVWRATHFSWWMTQMLHTHGDAFDSRLQETALQSIATSPGLATHLAENYTGLPVGG